MVSELRRMLEQVPPGTSFTREGLLTCPRHGRPLAITPTATGAA
jgi:hypothetical protein